jgi:uncharacterized membrane protein YfcA
MTSRDRARGLFAGLLAGFAGGLFGVGGGLVLIPALTGVFGLSQHQAHGTSLAVIGIAALASLIGYAWHGQVDWPAALLIAVASIPTSRLGARWAARTSPSALKRAFAVFMAAVALRLLWDVPPGAIGGSDPWSVANLAFDAVLGASAGLLAGYMGVGGGVIIVPGLVLARSFEQHLAQGTSLAVILGLAPLATLEHARHGNVAARWIVPLAAGAVLGGPLGAALAQKLPHGTLSRVFALFLLANAAFTWNAARRARSLPAPSATA